MHVNGRPVAAFDPEGLIFAAGVDSEMVKLYDLRSFDKVEYFNFKKSRLTLSIKEEAKVKIPQEFSKVHFVKLGSDHYLFRRGREKYVGKIKTSVRAPLQTT